MTQQAMVLLMVCASPVVGAPPFPTKELVAIAVRHNMPQPPKEARLVLAHTEGSQALGNQSTSRDPGIYAPAFLLAEQEGEITILRGMKQVVVRKRRNQPPWRPFSLEHVEPKLGGHVVSFNTLADFVCAVQLASRGDEKYAQGIWEQFASAEFRQTSGFGEAVPEKLDSPSLLLGRCLFDYYSEEILRSPADWPNIRDRMQKLLEEFPVLKTKERAALLEDLDTTVRAKAAAKDSTESLLLDWSRRPGEMRHLGLFHRENDKTNASAREIVLRGFDAVPDLIPLVSDRRNTVHGDDREGKVSVWRAGELAAMLLAEIAGKSEPDSAAWMAWWEKARRQKEDDYFAAAAVRLEKGKITWVNAGPARILGRKYPARLAMVCEEFSRQALPNTQPFNLAEAIAASSQPREQQVQILADFAVRGTLAHKRCVLQVLARLDGENCAKLLMPLLKTLPRDATGPYWTCPEAHFTHVVMQIENDEIWREYLRAAKRSSIGLRMEMMNPMNYSYIGEKNRQRRLAFLAAFLDDAEVRDEAADREKFDGPSAGFTFPKIAVRDYAADMIASILDVDDDLDEFSTPADWGRLREKVRTKLAMEKLPDLAGK